MTSADSIKNGLQMAGDGSIDILRFLIDNVVIPVVAVIILIFLICFIVGAVKKHRQGEDYHDDVIKIVVCVIGMALVLSFPSWGWAMIGMGTSGGKNSSSQTNSGTSASIQYGEEAKPWETLSEELPIKV